MRSEAQPKVPSHSRVVNIGIRSLMKLTLQEFANIIALKSCAMSLGILCV